ncbi:hypothetical protein GUITHDRAFT_155022 [Guillardia theta CCMP2712]|uniref:Uncharacterized protein n=2 Tax=Guillardia theta TaxID=55529 RepID=L1IN40_GUITC|nr:hypothetical protein GUITHDRAFT_155022 [Guillardia theta CCMP2712]EKX37215.1 hypothetical protein GUITHDRAFT_155022 [Guillardia theta CCMP2712]|eukprot:XP_005824195.1 hypothetical protein GUITHDRAFT_155022 [Guillardia theta CCMP2712]
MKRLLHKHQTLEKDRYAPVVVPEEKENARRQEEEPAQGEQEQMEQDHQEAAVEDRHAPNRQHVRAQVAREPVMSVEGQREMDEMIGMQIGKAISRAVAGTLKEEIHHVLVSELSREKAAKASKHVPAKQQRNNQQVAAKRSAPKEAYPAATSPPVKVGHPVEAKKAAAAVGAGGARKVAASQEEPAAANAQDPRKELDELQSKVETLAAMEREALDNLPQVENKEALARSSIASTLQSLRIAKDRSVLAQRAVDDDKVTSNMQQLKFDQMTAQRATEIEDAVKRELQKELHRQAELKLEAERGPLLARRLHLARKELREEKDKMKRWSEEQEAQKLEENMNFAA